MVDADNKLFIDILKMLRAACSSKIECESCPVYDEDNVDCLLAIGKLGGHPAFWDIEKLEDKIKIIDMANSLRFFKEGR